MISNNVYAWLSARNSFHNYLRIPCGFAKDEIDRFVTMNEKMDKQLDEFDINSVEKRITIYSNKNRKLFISRSLTMRKNFN